MRKKSILKTIFITSILLVSLVSFENVSRAHFNLNDHEISAVDTKTITIQKTFDRNTRIPSSIPYNKDGYVGTLKRHARPDYTDYSANKVTYTYSGVVAKSSGGGIGIGGGY